MRGVSDADSRHIQRAVKEPAFALNFVLLKTRRWGYVLLMLCERVEASCQVYIRIY